LPSALRCTERADGTIDLALECLEREVVDVHIRDGAAVRNRACYDAMGVNPEGERECGAKFSTIGYPTSYDCRQSASMSIPSGFPRRPINR